MVLSDETRALMDRYEKMFGEDVPMPQMPNSDAAIAALLRECIEARSTEPIDRLWPPGRET